MYIIYICTICGKDVTSESLFIYRRFQFHWKITRAYSFVIHKQISLWRLNKLLLWINIQGKKNISRWWSVLGRLLLPFVDVLNVHPNSSWGISLKV